MPFNIDKSIGDAVSFIKASESKRKKLAESLSGISGINLLETDSRQFLEERLFLDVSKAELNSRIAGIDSGLADINLHSLDFVLIRGMAALFEFKEGKLADSAYLPSFYEFPEPFVSSDALDNDEFQSMKGLLRLRQEISLAVTALKEFRPAYLFLDGSILPQYTDKPRPESNVTSLYKEVISLYESLYALAEKSNCYLVGAVEDSRGSRFINLLQQELFKKLKDIKAADFNNCSDSGLLDLCLRKNQRTMVFSYSSNPAEHAILKEFSQDFAERASVFYLKPSDFDRPLRLEFIRPKKDFSRTVKDIASTSLALSSLHKEYAFPSILIEADLRARLKPEEVKIISDKIMDRVGRERGALRLRRSSRPF